MADEWLKKLKAGDEVIVVGRGIYGKPRIVKVDRVTPSGRIVVEDRTFETNGHERGGNWYEKAQLQEPTTELREKIELATLAQRLGATHWGKLQLPLLREVAALLAKEGKYL